MKAYRFLLISILVARGFSQGYPQSFGNPEDIQVIVYNVEEGLNQSTVNKIIQDERGLIWLATGGGLQFFDGSRFQSFEPSFSLSGNASQDIIETTSGNFFISSGSSILSFKSSDGSFSTIDQKKPQYPRIFNTLYKKRPLCWMSSDRLCLIGDKKLDPVSLNFLPGNELPPDFNPVNLVKSKNGHFLLAGENGYLDLIPHNVHDTTMDARWIPFKLPCRSFVQDAYGRIIMLSEGTISSVDENGTIKEIFKTGLKESNLLFAGRSNSYWLADATHKKLYRISNGKINEIILTAREGKHTEIVNPAITTIFEDKNGNLWFGTDGNGLLFYSPGQLMFNLSGTGFTRCIEKFGGEIWAGTFRNGLWRLSGDLRIKTRVNPKILGDEIYFLDLISPTPDRLWAATSKGVYVLDDSGRVIFHYPLITTSATFIRLSPDKFMLSTYDGLYRCENDKKPGISFVRLQTQVREFLSWEGCNWVGNQFGLYRKDSASGILASLSFSINDRLTPYPVYSILPMKDKILVGTENGLQCYSPDGKRIELPASLNELKHGIVYSLLKDDQNRVWFSGNNGIGCIPAQNDRIIRFSLYNNIQSPEFNFNAALATSGSIYFGGIKGINGLYTGKTDFKNSLAGMRLISLDISDTAFTKGIPDENIPIRVSYNSPHFGGAVFSPAYFPAPGAEFSFFLEGYQNSWSKPSHDQSFSYRNLPPGVYRLWARCTDPFKNQGKPVCLLNIIISPPFWKTTWFMILCVIVFMSIIFIIFRKIHERKNREMIRQLEQRNAIDRERLRISQDMHDEIGSSLTQIAVLSEVLKKQNSYPEMTTMINKISGISGTLIDDIGEIVWAMNPKNDNLPGFISYLRQHSFEYLDIAGIHPVFYFPEECPPVPVSSELRRNLFLVVKESLHNVVKHSGADEVEIHMNRNDEMLSFMIKDNGNGKINGNGNGNGLPGMRKRIESLGGSFSISSEPEKGTRIEFSIKMSICRKN